MLKVILATVFGAFIGALVGLDLQTRFHLGIGAWSVSGLVGAVVGFLALKPTEVVAALKKAWNDLTGWRWHLHGYSAEYRKLWKLRAMWAGLGAFGGSSTVCIGVVIFDITLLFFVVSATIASGILVFMLCLFGNLHMPEESLLRREVETGRRLFLFYLNPLAVCVRVLMELGLSLWELLRILVKTPAFIFWVLRLLVKLLLATIRYSATHERFTVSVSAGTGAISGFFLGQGNTIFGLLGGAVFGVLFLFASKLLSAGLARQEG